MANLAYSSRSASGAGNTSSRSSSHATVGGGQRMTIYKPIPVLSQEQEARFWSRVQRGNASECWNWTASRTDRGYGLMWVNKSQYFAHRIGYSLLRGAIPTDMSLDHLCRNTGCVNPDHLEVCHHVVNSMRGTSPMAINARKIVCDKGHELRLGSRGKRYCPTCMREHDRIKPKRANPSAWRRSRGLCAQCNTPSVTFRCDRCNEMERQRRRKT
jgi:hypothetical protein